MSDAPWADLEIPRATLEKYDRPGPRYTSYPTAPHWSEDFGPSEMAASLSSLPAGRGLSLYVHVPFCEKRCLYCGCSVVITPQKKQGTRYVSYLERELDIVGDHLEDGPARTVEQIHWGGGTPTFLEPKDIRALAEAIRSRFTVDPQAEVSIEIDPRVTSSGQLELLRELGFSRLSLGVQDFDPRVQEAIGRVQPLEQTEEMLRKARALGFESVNVDLIYGLPHQDVHSFATTVDEINRLRPDRIALFSYAHVPWLKRHQEKMPTEHLPQGPEKFAIFKKALQGFTAAGYEFIGLDHFALPESDILAERASGRLHRNFQGYSTRGGLDLLGLGMTSISGLSGAYAQNVTKLADYYRRIDAGQLATQRGLVLSAEDRLRRQVISDLMCHGRLDIARIENDFEIVFPATFSDELIRLRELETDGLVEIGAQDVVATPLGRVFIRNVCMVFDAYLNASKEAPGYSRTV